MGYSCRYFYCTTYCYAMKLIIAGSRSITDINTVVKALYGFNIKHKDVEEIVSGGAKDVDKLGERIARSNKINVKIFKADWDKYGKKAGYLRNKKMGKYADTLLAVWDGESKGTRHMIDIMKRLNKTVYVYNQKDDPNET